MHSENIVSERHRSASPSFSEKSAGDKSQEPAHRDEDELETAAPNDDVSVGGKARIETSNMNKHDSANYIRRERDANGNGNGNRNGHRDVESGLERSGKGTAPGPNKALDNSGHSKPSQSRTEFPSHMSLKTTGNGNGNGHGATCSERNNANSELDATAAAVETTKPGHTNNPSDHPVASKVVLGSKGDQMEDKKDVKGYLVHSHSRNDIHDAPCDDIKPERLPRDQVRSSRDAVSTGQSRSPHRSTRRSRDISDHDDSRERRGRRRRRHRRYSDEDEDEREYRRRKCRRRHRSRSRSRSRSPKRTASEERERELRREERRARRREREREREAERERRRVRRGRTDNVVSGEHEEDTRRLRGQNELDEERGTRRDRSRYEYDEEFRRHHRRRRRRKDEREDDRSDVESIAEDEMAYESRRHRRSRAHRDDRDPVDCDYKGIPVRREERYEQDYRLEEERAGYDGVRDAPENLRGSGSQGPHSDQRPWRGRALERAENMLGASTSSRLMSALGWKRKHSNIRNVHKDQNDVITQAREDGITAKEGSHVSLHDAPVEREMSRSDIKGDERNRNREDMRVTPWHSESRSGEPSATVKSSVRAKVQAKIRSLRLDRLRSKALASMEKRDTSKKDQ